MTEKNISKYIGRRIKYYRTLRGMTQKELGLKIGVKHNTVSSYEQGINRPEGNILFALARALNIGINELFPPIKDSLPLKKESGFYSIGNMVMLPIVGRISCGDGVLAYEDIEGYEAIPAEWLNGGEHFCLRAKGDSMIGARIHDGDLLLIRKQSVVEDGEIAVILFNDEAVLKRLYRSEDRLVLQSENPDYPPIIVSPAEIKIIGKLKKVIINF